MQALFFQAKKNASGGRWRRQSAARWVLQFRVIVVGC